MSVKNYAAVESIDELAQHVQRLIEQAKPFGFDIETGYHGPDLDKASLHPETAIVVGFSFTNATTWARYVPLAHDEGPNLDNVQAARLLWPLLNTGLGVAHNAKFELRHLASFFRRFLGEDPLLGAAVRAARGYFPVRSDTQVEAYLMAEYQFLGLKPLTLAMFNHEMTELVSLFGDTLKKKDHKALRFNVLPLTPQVIAYACEDALWCLAIHEWYHPQVCDALLYRAEMGVITDACCAMEDDGVAYDWALMRTVAAELEEFRDRFNADIMRELSELAGVPVGINLSSPGQIGKVLYGQLGMATTVYTAGTKDAPKDERKMSTGKIALTGLAKQYAVVKRILQWKEITKLLNTYLTKYERLYNYAQDGRTHPNHLSAFVVTGRFAVSDPPYQQSPKRYHFDLQPAREAHAAHAEAHGPKCTCTAFPAPAGTCFQFNFRDTIVAPPGCYILGFDLSQAELRAIAGEAKEQALLDAFANGVDVHALTAALMLKKPLDEVSKDDRDVGKTMNFALLYGMGVKSLADRLGIPVDEAQALMDKYFGAYPNIATWSQKQVVHGKRYGYVTSRFGRRLPIWEFRSDKRWIQQKGERACVNYPIQGAATGDYMKIAMVRAIKALRAAGLHERVRLVMNVHDALEFYVEQAVAPQRVIEVLQPAVIYEVTGWPAMRADWHIAKRWGNPIEVELRGGTLVTKGSRPAEIAPAIEQDEDGEEIEVMPDVSVQALRAAAGIPDHRPSDQPSGAAAGRDRSAAPQPAEDADALVDDPIDEGGEPGRRLIIRLDAMPDGPVWQRFVGYLRERPGPNGVCLVTPEGELPVGWLAGGVSLTPSDRPEVSTILGPVTIAYAADDVDFAAIGAGLDL